MEQVSVVSTCRILGNHVECVLSCSIEGLENWDIYPLIPISHCLRAISRDVTCLPRPACPMYPFGSPSGARKPSGEESQRLQWKLSGKVSRKENE